MEIALDIDRKTWDRGMAGHAPALQQDWCYGAAIERLGGRVIRAQVRDGDAPLALAQFISRRFAGMMSTAMCARGPVWLRETDGEQRRRVYAALKSGLGLSWPRAVMILPDAAEDAGTRRMTRVMTGYSTVLLDLDQELDALRAGLAGKWRNRLVAAEKSDLEIKANGTKLAQYRWLLETEEGQRANRGYRAAPAQLVPEFAEAKKDRKSLLILRADLGRDKAAAMLFLIHGDAATYHMGWSSDDGRRLGAHNLTLWNALPELQARGVRQLDLGGVNTVSSAGIARFKIGTGGDVVTLAGTYL